MGRFGKPELAVLIVRDANEVAAVLRRDLDASAPEERPGLERALALVTEFMDTTDVELSGRWARRRLAEVGFDGPADSVAAVKALRDSEPGLSLVQAVRLSKDAAARHS